MKQQLVNMKCGMEKKWELLEEMRQRTSGVRCFEFKSQEVHQWCNG
jgi:hypothetical protein